LKNKIDRSLRHCEVRAYTLLCNTASSQATAASKNMSDQYNFHIPKQRSEGKDEQKARKWLESSHCFRVGFELLLFLLSGVLNKF
jgi:hypothetical protein